MIASPLRPRHRQESGIAAARPARPPRNALRRFTFVRHHDAPMASSRPALTEAPQRNQPHWDRPVNSGPRPCLFGVGFPLSGPQDRTSHLRSQRPCPAHPGLALRARPSRRRALCFLSTPSQRQKGGQNSRPLTPTQQQRGGPVSTGVDTTIAFSLEDALWIKRSQRVRSFGGRFAANVVSTSNSTAVGSSSARATSARRNPRFGRSTSAATVIWLQS